MRKSIMALEGIEEPVVDTTPLPEVDMSNELLDINEISNKIDDTTGSIDDAISVTKSLESLMTALKDSDGLDPTGAKILQISVESLCARVGYKKQVIPALEAFGGTMSKQAATQLALEGAKEVWDTVWKHIKAAFEKVKKFFSELYAKFDLAWQKLKLKFTWTKQCVEKWHKKPNISELAKEKEEQWKREMAAGEEKFLKQNADRKKANEEELQKHKDENEAYHKQQERNREENLAREEAKKAKKAKEEEERIQRENNDAAELAKFRVKRPDGFYCTSHDDPSVEQIQNAIAKLHDDLSGTADVAYGVYNEVIHALRDEHTEEAHEVFRLISSRLLWKRVDKTTSVHSVYGDYGGDRYDVYLDEEKCTVSLLVYDMVKDRTKSPNLRCLNNKQARDAITALNDEFDYYDKLKSKNEKMLGNYSEALEKYKARINSDPEKYSESISTSNSDIQKYTAAVSSAEKVVAEVVRELHNRINKVLDYLVSCSKGNFVDL